MKKVLFAALCCVMTLPLFAQERVVRVEFQTVKDSDYRELAGIAKGMGATHLECTQVEPSMWQWNVDRYDPYPCWSLHRPSVMKFIVPDELKKYFPEDYAKRNLERMKKRVKVLDEFGLKACWNGFDPAYFPEEAYLDHPEWRGARCDQSRRARKEYYTPNLDNPEVRRIFVDAIAELCKVAPFSSFDLMVNDSGSGLNWYANLYPGQNGPVATKNRSMIERIVDYLSMWQEGAAKAGIQGATVNLNRYLNGDIATLVLPYLKEGQTVLNKDSSGKGASYTIAFPNRFGDFFFPVVCMPRPVLIAEQLQEAQRNPSAPITIGLRSIEEHDAIRFLTRYMKEPIGEGIVARYQALSWLASTFVGEKDAEKLVSVWNDIESVNTLITPYNTGGHIFLLGTVHQRWLTRPFVAFPEELEGDDLHYWRDFLFQAESEKEAMDMLELQANRWLGGYSGFYIYERTYLNVRRYLNKAIANTKQLEASAVDAVAAKYLKGLELKLSLYKLVATNAHHAIEFQVTMDEGKAVMNDRPQESEFIRYQGDPQACRLDEICRNEIDNCLEIIRLMDMAESQGIELIHKADDKKFESIMNLGPDLKEQLLHKIKIMQEKRRDITRVYRSRNR